MHLQNLEPQNLKDHFSALSLQEISPLIEKSIDEFTANEQPLALLLIQKTIKGNSDLQQAERTLAGIWLCLHSSKDLQA